LKSLSISSSVLAQKSAEVVENARPLAAKAEADVVEKKKPLL
jgi:hypothetical protein